MMEKFSQELGKSFEGEILSDEKTLREYSTDASLFEVKPRLVVFPKNKSDVEYLINTVNKFKKRIPDLSITARSAGTDMSGGPINDSIIADFTKYFNHKPEIKQNVATTEPGVFYKDFEIETLKHDLIFPSYPASKTICAMGGIVNNNSGGEKSLQYGKTENYVKRLKMVLSDGNTYEIKPLNKKELEEKLSIKGFEGEIYRKLHSLIKKNKELIETQKPKVAKNSAGYSLWDVLDDKGFDMTKLFVGAQGTLGMMLEADIGLVPIKKHSQMVVVFLPSLSKLSEVIKVVLPTNPESFESYDDNTLKLALRYFPEFFKHFGIYGMIQAALAFLPAFVMMFFGRLPKLVLQIVFAGDSEKEISEQAESLQSKLEEIGFRGKIEKGDAQEKYWLVRRESFNLLRKKIRGKHTAPFVDDFVIDPYKIETVLPEVLEIIDKHPEFVFTIAAHLGEGNFHIIPIIDITDPKVRKLIPKVAKEVYDVIIKNGGSITGEHNDGLIRTPFLKDMFGKDMVKLFEEVKEIFDPLGIFNPRKKVEGDMEFAMDHLRQSW